MAAEFDSIANDAEANVTSQSEETRIGFFGALTSLVFALVTATVTAVMLLVNGSLVLVALRESSTLGPSWLHRPQILQFILFSVPIAMVILEWMLWDVFRGLLSFRSTPRDTQD